MAFHHQPRRGVGPDYAAGPNHGAGNRGDLGADRAAVRRIIAELEAAGYLHKKRVGRVSQYEVTLDLPLRQHVHREVAIGELLDILSTFP